MSLYSYIYAFSVKSTGVKVRVCTGIDFNCSCQPAQKQLVCFVQWWRYPIPDVLYVTALL